VAFDRNRKEQEALSALGKGDIDKAANLYAALLRHDPRDRRVRQKLSDLYLRVGRSEEAERHLRELAKLYASDGNNRATIAVYKKLLPLAPNDYGLLSSIGEAFLVAGFTQEAISNFEQAINGMEHRDPAAAAAVCLRLINLKPSDTPLRIKAAELLAEGGKKDESFEVYREIIGELRRRGRVDEVGRLALAALKLGKTADDLLQDAAQACLTVDDPEGALRHLQVAYQSNPNDPRTLDLLARSFEMGDQPEKARPILVALSSVLVKERRYSERVPVLERALAVAGDDKDLAAELTSAKKAEVLAEFRLTMVTEASPVNEAELRAAVRMSVLSRYGFGDRALLELCDLSQEVANSPAVQAQEAETRVRLGQVEEAIELAGIIAKSLSEQGQDQVAQRVAVLTGGDLSKWLAALPSASDELSDDDTNQLMSSEEDNSHLLDAAISAEDLAGDDILDDDILDDDILDDDILDDDILDDEIIEDQAEQDVAKPSGMIDMESLLGDDDDEWIDDSNSSSGLGDLFSGDGVMEIDPDDIPDAQETKKPDGSSLEEVESLLLLGMADEALAVLSGMEGLQAATLAARCMKENGDLKGAVDFLSEAIDSGSESEPGMAEALFLIADLIGRTKKHRAALRYLRELQDLHPDFKPSDVERRISALKMVLGR